MPSSSTICDLQIGNDSILDGRLKPLCVTIYGPFTVKLKQLKESTIVFPGIKRII